MILEACIETYSQAVMADKNGAHRLEVCAGLHLDGLTPSILLVSQIQEDISISLKVMIRPRAGNFCYSVEEINLMIDSILSFREIGIDHFVLGILTPGQKVDIVGLRKICSIFPDGFFTFHKAIDLTSDIISEVNILKTISNVNAILTSGGALNAMGGAQTIREMIKEAGTDIQIVAAGGITNSNLREVHNLISAKAYHGKKIVGALN